MTSAHAITLKTYGAVFTALLILTALTTGVAFLDLGSYFNTVIALTIACAKATLVVLYFMHLRYSLAADLGHCRRRIVLVPHHDEFDPKRCADPRNCWHSYSLRLPAFGFVS